MIDLHGIGRDSIAVVIISVCRAMASRMVRNVGGEVGSGDGVDVGL